MHSRLLICISLILTCSLGLFSLGCGSGASTGTNSTTSTSTTTTTTLLTQNLYVVTGNSSSGYYLAGGTNGLILVSNADGTSWSSLETSPTTETIRVIHANGSVLFIAGDHGMAYLSTNEGGTFSPVNVGTVENFYSFGFKPAKAALLGGAHGALYRANNPSLSSWSAVPDTYDAILQSIYYLSVVGSLEYYLSGSSGLYGATTDGGVNWATYTPPTPFDIYDLETSNTLVLFFAANGVIVSNNNSSDPRNWTTKESTTTKDLYKAQTLNGITNIVAVGESGTIIKSSNTGESWSSKEVAGLTSDLYCIYDGFGGAELLAVGASNKIIRSVNGGSTWTIVYP